MGLELRAFGPLELYRDGTRVPIASRLRRVLLAVLLVHRDQVVPVSTLTASLWPARPPAAVAKSLHIHVHRLRRALGGAGALPYRSTGYALAVAPEDVDIYRFDWLVRQGRAALSAGDHPTAAETLRQAIELCRGPALQGMDEVPELAAEAGRIEELRLVALEGRFAAELALGESASVVAELDRLVAAYPLRERFRAQLMLALYRAGRKADALTVYRNGRRILVEELGIEPNPECRELERAILVDHPALNRSTDPGGTVWSANPVPHQPPSDLSANPVPHQLPSDLTDFAGRTAELAWLDAPLPDHPGAPPTGVVTSVIDGPPGVGKTALAVHAAHRLAARYPDGQLLLDLHGFTEAVAAVTPAEALERMLRVLGVPGAQIPAHLEDRAALWRSRLAGKRILIVLDNAATEAQVRPLLPGSPGCLALVTSRTRLPGLDGARSLSLEVMSPHDAHALFVSTAGEQRLSGEPPELLDEIVELCGHLPLAIRIAAARLASHPTWGVAQLVDRLRDHRIRLGELQVGQRSVTAALDLSYRQLPDDQRRGYRLLGLHPGPDIDVFAAAALTDTTPDVVCRLLDQLLEANLLEEPAPGRHRFHDLTRAHAAQQAAQADTDDSHAALTRLLDYFRYAASVAMDILYPYDADQRPHPPRPATPEPALAGWAQAATWLDTELSNLLVVAAHAAGHGWPRHCIDLSTILGRHLRTRCSHADAQTLHSQALAAADDVGDRRGQLDALTGLGLAHALLRAHQLAEDCLRRALEIARGIGHRVGELTALNGLGTIHRAQARHGAAADSFELALEIARGIGHRRGELVALLGLGYVHRMRGGYRPAADRFEQARAISRDIADRGGETTALSGLGFVNRALGRYSLAVDSFERALAIARAGSDRISEVNALWGLGQVSYVEGRRGCAVECFANALAIAREIGDRNGQFEGMHGLGLVRCATGDPGQALADHRAAHQLALELGQPVDQARALHGMGRAHRDLGEPEQARRCWQQSLAMLERLGVGEVEEVSVHDLRANLVGSTDPDPASQEASGNGMGG